MTCGASLWETVFLFLQFIGSFRFVTINCSLSHWRDTLELLLQRKYLFHLGPRGALHILAKCIFYIAKLRHICLLAPEDRKVFKSKLRKDLALRRNFPRLSFALSFYPAQKANHQECFKLSKQNRHGYISPVLSFPQLGDFDKVVDWMKLSLDQLFQNDLLDLDIKQLI